MAQFGTNIEEDLQLIDIKLKQLKNEYEQYFLGTRKREPHMLRTEVNKMVTLYINLSIKNTGYRFKFNNLRARFFTFRRHWDETCRKIDEGRYERHIFKANLKERGSGGAEKPAPRTPGRAVSKDDIFESYVSAREACGQATQGITREKLAGLLKKQEAAIRSRFDCEGVRFRVVVEDGEAKLKATALKGGPPA